MNRLIESQLSKGMYCNIDTDRGVEFQRNIDTIDRSNTIFID